MFSTVFCNPEVTTEAIHSGLVIDGVNYKAIPYKDKTIANDYIRIYLNLNRQESNVDVLAKKTQSLNVIVWQGSPDQNAFA